MASRKLLSASLICFIADIIFAIFNIYTTSRFSSIIYFILMWGLLGAGAVLLFFANYSKQKKFILPFLISVLVTLGVFIVLYATILIAGFQAM